MALGTVFGGLFPAMAVAQAIAPQGQVAAGGYGSADGTSLSWTLGQPASGTFGMPGHLATAGIQQPEGNALSLHIRVLLDGAYRADDGLMDDALRSGTLLPAAEPYSAIGLVPSSLPAGVAYSPLAFWAEGPDAVVDWVFVELRDAAAPAVVVAARAALLQRDGDVVEGDGTSPLRMAVPVGAYHVAVHHRNHLPVMTQLPMALTGGTNTIDLTDGNVATHGTNAQRHRDGRSMLWAGDVNRSGIVKYTGDDNDRDPVLTAIGGVVPTATIQGYHSADVNLDGTVKYTGLNNDRDPILQTIGGVVPTATRSQQMP